MFSLQIRSIRNKIHPSYSYNFGQNKRTMALVGEVYKSVTNGYNSPPYEVIKKFENVSLTLTKFCDSLTS
jgi:hypothetical protein